MAPVQLSGQVDGPITGTIGAIDPEDDPLTYRLRRAPKEGSAQLDADGTYTYTPGSRFDGVDTFGVVVIDEGRDAGLLRLFRRWGTSATAVINQRAITFDSDYTESAQHWTADRRDALQRASDNLMLYLVVSRPVTLTYEVEGKYRYPGRWPRPEAISPMRLPASVGRWQHKLLTGLDANGKEADGWIRLNFGEPWALGDVVAADGYDFTAVVLHELVHSSGFLTVVGTAGENTDRNRTVFDRFIVNADGTRTIGWGLKWDDDFDPNLTGGNGGLYFGGPNAVAAYGAPVPLYTSNPWRRGSSVAHLDDETFTGVNRMRMVAYSDPGLRMVAYSDPGLGVRTLSAVELGILRDLGYQVAGPQMPVSAAAFVGLVFIGARRKKAQ